MTEEQERIALSDLMKQHRYACFWLKWFKTNQKQYDLFTFQPSRELELATEAKQRLEKFLLDMYPEIDLNELTE